MISFLPGAVSPRHLAAVNGGALLIAFAPIFAILSTRGEDGEECGMPRSGGSFHKVIEPIRPRPRDRGDAGTEHP